MLSVVLPIGKYPFFVYACLGNITATAGADVDIVFLTYKKVAANLQAAFDEAAKTYKFRVIQAPFNVELNHLPLLDWAMRNADLQEWVVIQHCDFFWDPKMVGWAPYLESLIEPDLFVIHPQAEIRFTLDEKPVPTMHDYVAMYHRPTFAAENLSFNWSVIDRDVKLSAITKEAVESKRLLWKEPREKMRRNHPPSRDILLGVDWLDGSITLTLEVAMRFLHRAKPFKWKYYHLWQFFKIAHGLRKVGGKLTVGNQRHGMLFYYSWITSFCFDKDEYKDIILPWAVMQMVPNPQEIKLNEELANHISSFHKEKNALGRYDTMGITRVVAGGKEIPIIPPITFL
jgi:hypothetical protein